MELHLRIVGFLFMALSVVHFVFPRKFDWKNQLQSLSLINKQMMQVHTFFIALAVLLMGLLCVYSPHELTSSALGRTISLGLFVFWFVRLIVQLFVYSPSLWRGKTFETIVHVLFTCFWMYCSAVFLLSFLG